MLTVLSNPWVVTTGLLGLLGYSYSNTSRLAVALMEVAQEFYIYVSSMSGQDASDFFLSFSQHSCWKRLTSVKN